MFNRLEGCQNVYVQNLSSSGKRKAHKDEQTSDEFWDWHFYAYIR